MNHYRIIFASGYCLRLILLIAITVTLGIPAYGDDRWFRAVHYDGAVEETPVTVEFVGLRYDQELAGEVSVARNILPGQPTNPFVIEGRVADNGKFWLRGQIQVSNDRSGEWKTVTELPDNGASGAVTVYPGLTVTGLSFNVDAVKPLIGKFKFGRVVLKTGEAAIFLLDDLSPPSEFQRK